MHVSSNICTYNKDLFICEISFCIYDLVIGDREINYVLSSFSLAIPRFYFVCQPASQTFALAVRLRYIRVTFSLATTLFLCRSSHGMHVFMVIFRSIVIASTII